MGRYPEYPLAAFIKPNGASYEVRGWTNNGTTFFRKFSFEYHGGAVTHEIEKSAEKADMDPLDYLVGQAVSRIFMEGN
ncbi:MAG: hypothetical protein HZB67_01045 [Candidatus Aenigmarchaeota archaeon]|nr:hypothetical protein [Candidatus Aenigmarchaeota archaeon]